MDEMHDEDCHCINQTHPAQVRVIILNKIENIYRYEAHKFQLKGKLYYIT